MKTLIAIPCMDTMPVGFVQSLIYMEKGQDVTVGFKANSLVYDSRNLLSLTAIQKDIDRVLWLDSDMMIPPYTLKRLAAHMDENPSVRMVTGLYVKRHEPVTPVLYKQLDMPTTDADGNPQNNMITYDDFPRDSYFPVKGCGFGCVLTATSLLKDVWDKFGPAFAPFPWAGEDIAFCYRVNQLGETIMCDSSVSCGHIGTRMYTEYDLGGGEHEKH